MDKHDDGDGTGEGQGEGTGEGDGGGGDDERRQIVKEVVDEVKGLFGGLLGEGKLKVEDEGGDGKGGKGGDGKGGTGPASQKAEEDSMAEFVKNVVSKLDDDKVHRAEHERIAAATKAVEEPPEITRAVTRFMWGSKRAGAGR